MEETKARKGGGSVSLGQSCHCKLLTISVAEKTAGKNDPRGAKDAGEELDQVAGNAEDEIGERVAGMRESELLYGPNSLLAVFGPMLVHICGSPPKFKVCCRPTECIHAHHHSRIGH